MFFKYSSIFSVFFSFSFILFFFVVLVVSLCIFIYNFYYLSYDYNFLFYKFMLFLFVMSMLILILSGNYLTFFFGWDGLGISSYFLVSFYFNIRCSSSAMTTLMSNRVGDCLFFVILVSGIYSWMEMEMISLFILLFLIFVVFTKSAQYPFSSWLPLAMAAPTPISALVHSSTLVTAGVFLIMKFYLMSFVCLIIFFMVSIITLFQSGLMSLMESDLKKLVAFSTLNQIGFILLTISFSFFWLAMSHLLIHAIFKSLLFLSVGVFIHLSFSSQNNFKYFPFIALVCSGYSLMSLFAICYTSGMYSKDFILEMILMNNLNYLLVFVVFLSILFTFMYSFRMFKSLFYMSSMKISKVFSSWFILIPLCFLSLMSLILSQLFFGMYLIIFFLKNKIFIVFLIMFMLLIFMYFNSLLWVSLNIFTFSFSKVKSLLTGLKMMEFSWLEMLNHSPFSLVFMGGFLKLKYMYIFFFLFFVFWLTLL